MLPACSGAGEEEAEDEEEGITTRREEEVVVVAFVRDGGPDWRVLLDRKSHQRMQRSKGLATSLSDPTSSLKPMTNCQ